MATLKELRDNCKADLNVNASQIADDISEATWNRLINQAYNKVWKELRTQVSREAVVQSVDIQWPSGALTMDLPLNLQNATLHQIFEVTSQGVPLRDFPGFFETRNVLRIYGAYPYNATLRVYFIPEAEPLAVDSDSPTLIPPQHHDFIEWETLILVKQLQDKEVPAMWSKRYDELKFSLFNEFKSRPFNPRPAIRLPGAPMARPLI